MAACTKTAGAKTGLWQPTGAATEPQRSRVPTAPWCLRAVQAAGALAISAMVLPGISGLSLLMSCGLYLPVITAMKDLLHFEFGQFWLLAAVGLGVLAGFAVAPH